MQAQEVSRTQDVRGDMDGRLTGTENRGRTPADVVKPLKGPTLVQDRRCKRNALRVAGIAEKEIVEGHAH